MVEPEGRVLRLYWPVFCRATPQAESAPVQLFSVVGLGFWASGSGWLVLMIQSALPAVSALLLSNSTRCGVALTACTAVADAGAVGAAVAAGARVVRPAASSAAPERAATVRMRIVMCRSSVGS